MHVRIDGVGQDEWVVFIGILIILPPETTPTVAGWGQLLFVERGRALLAVSRLGTRHFDAADGGSRSPTCGNLERPLRYAFTPGSPNTVRVWALSDGQGAWRDFGYVETRSRPRRNK